MAPDEPEEEESSTSTGSAGDSKLAKSGDGNGPTKAGPKTLRPSPAPPPPHTQVNLALALQQTSLENLDPAIQRALIESADLMDQRGFEYAQSALRYQGEAHQRETDDRATGRQQLVWAGGLLAGAILLAGTLVAYLFINAGQFHLAQTIMVAGISAIGGFLGGLGVGEVARRFTSA